MSIIFSNIKYFERICEFMNEIGERIRLRRNELDITQTQVYKEVGISSGNLSSIESGKVLPSSLALIGLSKVLKCSIDWILTGDEYFSESEFFNNRENELISNFRMLSDSDKQEILNIIEYKIYKSKEKELLSHSNQNNNNDLLA